MKIAILTIYDVHNYGATLQAYATYRFFSSYGQVEIIPYQNNYLNISSKLLRTDLSFRGVMRALKDLIRIKPRYKLIQKFNDFNVKNLKINKKLSSKNFLNEYYKKFDALIVGSDQLWNPRVISGTGALDSTYFLDFIPIDKENIKRISFSTSTGGAKYTKSQYEELRERLKNFDYISIREEILVKDFSEGISREVDSIVDPTLLLDKSDWEQLVGSVNEIGDKDYILVYGLKPNQFFKDVVNTVARKFNLKVVVIDQNFPINYKSDKHVRDAGPLDFLNYFINASFVLTNSFHGTAFSINFNKPFYSILPDHGAERIENLLELCDLSSRGLRQDKDLIINNVVDYTVANQVLSKERKIARRKMNKIICSS